VSGDRSSDQIAGSGKDGRGFLEWGASDSLFLSPRIRSSIPARQAACTMSMLAAGGGWCPHHVDSDPPQLHTPDYDTPTMAADQSSTTLLYYY
jgi:hypothetical protein